MLARVAKNAGAQILSQLVQFGDRFLVVGVLLRCWGTQVYSEWALLVSSVGLLSLGELGLNIYYGNVLQEAWVAQDTRRFQRTVSVALTCSGAVAAFLGCCALVFLAAADLPAKLSIRVLPRSEAVAVVALMGAMTLSRIARGAISQIYRGRQEFAVGLMVDLVSPASTLIITVIAVLIGAGPAVVAGVCLAVDLIAGWGIMVWSLGKRYPDLHIKPAYPTRPELFALVRHVKWLAVQQGGPVAWLQIPVLTLGYVGVASASLVGFVLLRTLVNFMRSAGTMLSIGSGVETIACHHAGRTNDAIRSLQTVGQWLSVFSTSIAVGLIAFGHPLVSIWTGWPELPELYDPNVVFCLVASAVLAAPSMPFASHLMLANTPHPLSIALLVQLAVGLSVCAALACRYGAAGAAAGLALGETVAQAVILPILVSAHLHGYDYWRYLGWCLLAMTLTALWCSGVTLGALAIFDTGRWPGVIAAGATWALLGLLPALMLALPARQREALALRLRLSAPRATKTVT